MQTLINRTNKHDFPKTKHTFHWFSIQNIRNEHILHYHAFSSLLEPFTCYQEWDLHLDEITEGVQTSHLKKSFTLYYFSHGTVEIQMITILNILKKEIESKKFVGKLELYKSY